MTLALLGLIAFQWYWVSNYFEANKRELDWEINRVLARTSERYLNESLNGFDYFSWSPDSSLSTTNSIRDNYSLYHKNPHQGLHSVLNDHEDDVQSMGEDYMAKVSGLINNLLQQVNHPKIINFDRLLEILDEELKGIGIENEYNLAISNINNKVIYYKEPETLQATIMFGYKSPVILSSISNPYFTHLFIFHKVKLLLQKTWIILFSSFFLIIIILACFAYALHIIFDQKKVSEIKNDFVNNMTHELKTPISTVSLALEAMVNFDVRSDEKRTLKYLEISRKEIRRLSTMVEKVLNTARYERGEIDLKKEQHSINNLIENVVETMSMQVQKKNGTLDYELNAISDTINVDKIHINNLLYNLIDNSNKYFIDIPQITIRTEDYEKGVILIVSDKGIGILKDELRRVFDKFYRVPTGNIHNVKGYGLGLSYVKDIVEMHGGKLEVLSDVNIGTTFTIYLPYEYKD
jgi:two-component system phosphate regulon sensor histidine kinase PhoR